MVVVSLQIVIHHGGAGTISADMRSGIPIIVISFTADQPFWGRTVHAIGAGSKPIPVQKLSVENLTQSILWANDEAIRKCAQNIGQELRNEAGVEVTINRSVKYSDDFKERSMIR